MNKIDATQAEMVRLYGSKFVACKCGRTDVLMYKRGGGNGPDADRLTYHDTPAGVRCERGGEVVAGEIP